MKLRMSIVPLCECGKQMVQESYAGHCDGIVWHCYNCWTRYLVLWTYVDALVMPELRKEAIERKPE